ncbi:MAG: acetyl-CoA C-acyltransferase [Alphaproteobacteria bacterium]|nr:acetyl-CoA C-acyltransferase [Alphaproteobacteria bacterium]
MSAFIHDAVRTPRGKARPDGGLAALKPQQLVSGLVRAMGERGADVSKPDALIVGAVGQIGAQGGHIALVSKFDAGLPDETAALSINNYCVSGLSAIGQAAAMVESGQARSVLAGGVEMMSRVPFMADNADFYADASYDRRTRYIPVALAADRLAQDVGVSRAELDQAALVSQQRTAAAEGTPLVASRIALNGLNREECARPTTTAESLAAMAPAFPVLADQYRDALGDRLIDHRHTVGHAPPMADGAAMALIGADAAGARARIVAWAEAGGDPAQSLTAGFTAMQRVLEKARLTLSDLDRIEFMEAFGVTIVTFMRDFGPDAAKVNVGGGHIAKGHPMGATGAILLASLLDALDASGGKLGLVVAAGASGVGSAMIVERLER